MANSISQESNVRLIIERKKPASLADDLDEDSIGQGGVSEDVDDAVPGEAPEHGIGLGVGVWRSLGLGRIGSGFEGGRSRLASGWRAFHAAVHGLVGEAVGVLVLMAKGMRNLEGFELGDAILRLLPEGFQVG